MTLQSMQLFGTLQKMPEYAVFFAALHDKYKLLRNLGWTFNRNIYFFQFLERFLLKIEPSGRVAYTGKNFGWGVQGRGSGLVGAGEFSKICKKIPGENCKKCCIFAYFAKKFQNHAVNFSAFGRKTQFFGKFFMEKWKKLEKLNFYLFSWKICC